MKIAVGCDHGALALKNKLVSHLEAKGFEVKDFGTYTPDSCDYPEFAGAAAKAVASGEFAGQGYGKFKPVVGEAVVEHLRPIREESLRLMKDKAYLESVYRDGAQKASYVAEKTLRKVYKKVGFVAK